MRHFRIVFDNFPPEVKIDAWAARGCAIIAKGPGPEPPVDAAELGAAGPITLSNLAGGRQSIVVGAAVDRHFTTGTDYLPCSAAGRTRTDYEQPCVLACGQYHHYPRVDLTASPVSGTSHATAAVTAVVARHLSACGALVELETASAEEQRIDVRSRLCKVFEMKGAMHDSRRGFGFLDIDTVQKFLRQLE